ncbi:hypothetical protein HDG37_000233 [Paraburkholderia sp. MM5384-R2]|nr:hypothetical protein [Paraburkholderia sp. MM5384-R2]
MRHDEDAAMRVEHLVLDEFDHRAAGVAIERGGRLIEDQDVGLAEDRACDGNTLLLAAGDLPICGLT